MRKTALTAVIALGLLGLVFASQNFFSRAQAAASLSYGPVVGATTDTTASIWVRTSEATPFEVWYKKTTQDQWLRSYSVVTNSDYDFTAVVKLSNLAADTRYDYKVMLDGVEVATSSLKTLPAQGKAGTFTFVVGADIYYPLNPHNIFDKIAIQNPDFALFIGDNMYADLDGAVSTLAGYRSKYQQNWGEAKFASFLRRFPSFFIWDDHEITNDWSSGKTGQYTAARQAADEYHFKANPTPRVGGELYYSFKVGEAEFYVLDTRSYRSANGAADDANKTMLGATQKEDLKKWLSSSTAKFKFIVSSITFTNFGTTGSDAWEGFTTERSEIFNYISNQNVEGVVLLTGDQHFSLVTELNNIAPKYNLFEFLPTPLNITNRTETNSTDSQILFKQDDSLNYGYFKVDTTVNPAKIDFVNYDTNNGSLYQLRIYETDINQNTSPKIKITETIPSSHTGDLDIAYTLSDPDNDTITIKGQYSLDGITWQDATLANGSAGKVKGSSVKLLTWQTFWDLTGDVSGVYFRVRANDSKMEGPWRYLGDNSGGPGESVAIENSEVKGVKSTKTVDSSPFDFAQGEQLTVDSGEGQASMEDIKVIEGIEGSASLSGWLTKVISWIASLVGQIIHSQVI